MIDLRKIYFPQKPTSSHLNYQLSIINSKSSSVQSVQIRVQKNIFRVQISPRRIPPIHHQIAARHPSRGIAQEIAASIGNVIRVTKVKQIQGAVSISLLRAPPSLHRAGCAGYGRHGGEAPALCVGSDDVGLDSSVH